MTDTQFHPVSSGEEPEVRAQQQLALFFERFSVEETQQHIWEILSAALGSENADFWDRHQRATHVWFCQQVDLLVKAAAVLHQKAEMDKKDGGQKG